MRQKNDKKGFTLIEILVAIAIMGIVLGIALTILGAILRSSTKTTLVNQVKQNGDLALETMTRSVRSAVDICSKTVFPQKKLLIYASKVGNCETTSIQPIEGFICTEGDATNNGSLKKTQESGDDTPIVSNVKIKEDSCRFVVHNTSPRQVIIDFTLKQDVSLSDSADTKVDIPFHTEITLRNF